jgi:hypothetical protein
MDSTKFMDKLFVNMKVVGKDNSKALEGNERKDITVKQYIARLKKLNNDKPFSSLSFLKDVEGIVEKIKARVQTTQGAYYSAIVIALSIAKSHKALLDKYKEHILPVWQDMITARNTNEKNEKQKENIVPMDDILTIKNKLKEEINDLNKKKVINEKEYEKYIQYVLVSLYTDIPPRRNQDYMYMVVVKKRPSVLRDDMNYLIVNEKKFVFNKYKTSRKHHSQEIDIPDSLMETLTSYFKRRMDMKSNTEVSLLLNYNGSETNKVNYITRMLNKTFGKKIGASALRHIYLSDKYADTEKEMQKDAEAMAHSVDTQKEYIKY